jgi:aminomethyltransferase
MRYLSAFSVIFVLQMLVRRLFSSQSVRRTPLYDFHVRHGGRMVEFAGWSLPVQYTDMGIIDSCLHTRSRASLFDVSHMLQVHIHGKDRERFVESVTVGDIQGLKVGESRLTLLTTKDGGIIDDSVVSKREEFLNVVLNAGCADKDLRHLKEQLASFKGDAHLEIKDSYGLVALQGPASAEVLQPLLDNIDLKSLAFMSSIDATVAGVRGCFISRSGYTGEDGFEISIPTGSATNNISETLLGDEAVKLAGLGARDTLRVEAGLCLYGSDIDEYTTPIEAGLAWTISKRRRLEGGFPGADRILSQIKSGVTRKRVGLTVLNGPPARHGSKICASASNALAVGEVTSGTFSPSIGKPVAIGYVSSDSSAIGTELVVDVRGKLNPVVVTKLPFVRANYYRLPSV